MRHHTNYGCIIRHVNLHGHACLNHDMWLGIDGFESKGRFAKKPSEVKK